MRKQEFLDTLRKDLKVLRQDEINDILEEYSGYIESMMEEGRTEEEAVGTFGNPTALAKEILSAYKVSDDYLNHTKAGEFVDKGSHLFSRAIDYLSDWFRIISDKLRTSDPGSVVQVLLTVLIGLVLIVLMRIPFVIVEWIGSMMVELLLGGGYAARFLSNVWAVFVNVCFLAASVLVIISMVRGGLGDRFRSIMARHGWMKARPAAESQSFHGGSAQQAAEEAVEEEIQPEMDSLDQELDRLEEETAWAGEEAASWYNDPSAGDAGSDPHCEEESAPHKFSFRKKDAAPKEPREPKAPSGEERHALSSLGGCLASFFVGCLKVAGILCISFPLLLLTLVGAFITGNAFALMTQGISLTGPTLCALGGTVACGLLTTMSVFLICRHGKGVSVQVIPLVISIVVCGFGLVMSFFEIADYEFVKAPSAPSETDTYTVSVSDRSFSVFGSRVMSVQEDESLPQGTMRLEISYDGRFFEPPVVNQQTDAYLSASSEAEREHLWEEAMAEYEREYERYEEALNNGEDVYAPEFPDQQAIYDNYYESHKVYRDQIDIYAPGDGEWNTLNALWDFYVEGLRSHHSFTTSQLTIYLSSDLVPRLYSRNRYSIQLDSADRELQKQALDMGGYTEGSTILSPDDQDLTLPSDELYPQADSWKEELPAQTPEASGASGEASADPAAESALSSGEASAAEPDETITDPSVSEDSSNLGNGEYSAA